MSWDKKPVLPSALETDVICSRAEFFKQLDRVNMQFFSAAQCVGYIAFVFGILAFLQKSDRRLRIFIAVECLAYTVHFFLLGNLPASFSTLVSCGRSLLSLKTRSRVVAALIIVINVAFGLLFVKTWVGWIPVSSACLATIAFFGMQGIAMRLVLLVCTFLWLANNIICGSIGGTLLETLIAIANTSTMIRLFTAARRESRIAPQSKAVITAS